jgi:uncharacterized membrane protein YhhN
MTDHLKIFDTDFLRILFANHGRWYFWSGFLDFLSADVISITIYYTEGNGLGRNFNSPKI